MKLKLARFGIVLALMTTLNCRSAILTPLSIEQLAGKADVVVHGRVISQTCQRDVTGQIYTSVTLAIEELWKGIVDTNSFRIVHSGGVLGDEIETCSAQVDYRIGEEVVALLVLNERGEGVTLGLVQGKFEVSTDALTGGKYAENLFHGRKSGSSQSPTNRTAAAPDGSSGDGRLALAELKQKITGGVK